MQYAYWAPLSSFAASLLAVWWLSTGRVAALVLDKPNERSLHHTPTPRTGGVGVLLGILCAWLMVQPDALLPIAAATVAVAVVSFADDVVGMPASIRLAVHLLAAGYVCFHTDAIHPNVVIAILAAVSIAWMTNLYNFMDGSDGLAGGMTVIGFSIYGVAALMGGAQEFALINFSIAASALGFLIFNFHPARIFLGDVGSVPLGFLAGALGVFGCAQVNWPWWFPLMVFSPFIVDASITLLARLMRGERVWQAHRDHFYQRLVRMGYGHRNTALGEYMLMTVSGLCALAALAAPFVWQMAAMTLLAATYIVLALFIECGWRRHGLRDKS